MLLLLDIIEARVEVRLLDVESSLHLFELHLPVLGSH